MKITVLGGGTSGWLTVLFLKKHLPTYEISLIESEKIGIIGVGEGTTPMLIPFLDDLEINITMFRENYKPVVNLNIIFEGKNYPDINYMSGGQIDRISIALTLTFNIILNTPIIMLDETIDSLEEEKKKACLDSIKENIKNKIILITCPDSIEGFFDEIINL